MTSPAAECPACRAGAAAGFTLFETLVVLAVLGLVLGLVVGRGPARSHALDARAAAATFAQALRGARARAIADDRVVQVVIDPAGRSYRVDGTAPVVLPDGLAFRLAAGGGVLGFAPDGSATGARVLIEDGRKRTDIAVDWLTGRVSVADAS